MRLSQYLKATGRTLHEVALEAGIAYTTALRARDATVSYPTAVRISAATDGRVTVKDLCEPPRKRGGR